ncbi:epithelial sodium channel subunit beta-like [Haemaphysalis longicornis]
MHISERGIVRSAIWTISLAGFLSQTGIMLKMYFQYPFSVTVVEELQRGIMFPAVTVCVENWINRSAFCALANGNCGDGDQLHHDRALTLEYDLEARAKVAVPAAHMVECHLRSSDPTCVTIRCTVNIARTYFRRPHHMCYTLDLIEYGEHGSPFQQCKAPWTWELEMDVYWTKKALAAIEETGKFPVIVHRPETCLPDKLSAIVGETGIAYILSITQQTVKRLPSPYASKCTDYAKYGKNKAYGGFMNQDTCVQDCQMKLQKRHCGCVDPALEFAGSVGMKGCSPDNAKLCLSSLNQNNTFKVCEKRCRAPCRDTTYDVRLTGMGVASSKFLTYQSKFVASDEINLFSLVIKFSSDTQKIFVYEPNLTIVETFGYTGGYLGMWLGFSLLSILKGLEKKIMDFFVRRTKVQPIALSRDGKKQDMKQISRALHRRLHPFSMALY